MEPLKGVGAGPGIAAAVVTLTVLDRLVERSLLSKADIASILDAADAELKRWGDATITIRDARRVIKLMRGA